jgi:16S rRNA (cytosine967-C5)-methyltransferase
VSAQNPREIAVNLLARRDSGQFIENLLSDALRRSKMGSSDRALCQELTYGMVRWRDTLDWLIARKTENRAQHRTLQNLLRLGLYQIFWLERIPHHAAVHETVELGRSLGFSSQAGFVNAVLRGYLRELEATKKLLNELKLTQPPLGYSHPEWLVARWQKRWGADNTAKLMEWNNTPPKTFARVNTLKTDPGKLLLQWREENVEYDFVRRDWIEENLVFELRSHPPLDSLKSFQEGLFYIQDPGTLLAVRELEPKPDETILDTCAAPGGKLTFIAQLMRNEGRLTAHDISADRLKLIEENCQRLSIKCAEVTDQLPKSPGSFDRVLVDAPCSNTGVLRRRVDLRWRSRPEEIQKLASMQVHLLRQTAGLLKIGGVLVYSTCSLEPEENQEVVKRFLDDHRDFSLEHERELTSFADGVDGAYVARLKRVT